MSRIFFSSLLLLMTACATSVGAGDVSTLPDDAGEICEAQCESLEMEFDGVAVGKRSVDCLCEPDD
jgi:hypothetical protein